MLRFAFPRRGLLAGLVVLGAAYLGLAGWVPPADDELYYWCWARDLQLSYFDHPPMTAYLIRASTALFGDSLAAVRLPACLASLVVLGVIGVLSRPRALLPAVALTPLFTVGAVLVTPDTPLLLFWSLYLLWLVAAHRRLDAGHVPMWMWVVGGLLLGCSALGKYTTALSVPASFLSFALARRQWRAWVPGYVLHGAVSAGVAVPVLLFNLRHDFAPLRFQWEHAMTAGAGGLEPFGEFLGVQVLLFGTLPVVLFPWVLANFRSLAADPRLRACACLYAVPWAFFLYKAAKGPLEGNWALACYVGFWPVAAKWYETVRPSAGWRWATAGAFAVPVGCVVLLAVHLVHPVGLLSPRADRITRQAVKMEVAKAAAAAVAGHGEAAPVYTPTYQWTAFLRFHGVDARQIAGATRPSHFTLGRPEQVTDSARAYVFSEGPLPAGLVPGYGPPEIVANIPLAVRGELITYYQVLLYTRPGTRPGEPRAVAARP